MLKNLLNKFTRVVAIKDILGMVFGDEEMVTVKANDLQKLCGLYVNAKKEVELLTEDNEYLLGSDRKRLIGKHELSENDKLKRTIARIKFETMDNESDIRSLNRNKKILTKEYFINQRLLTASEHKNAELEQQHTIDQAEIKRLTDLLDCYKSGRMTVNKTA